MQNLMKQVFHKYVKGVLCSFLRITTPEDPYYLVTFKYSGSVRNCKIEKDDSTGWKIENESAISSPYMFFNELIGTIEQNEFRSRSAS